MCTITLPLTNVLIASVPKWQAWDTTDCLADYSEAESGSSTTT